MKYLILALLASVALARPIHVETLVSGTLTATGASKTPWAHERMFQATGATASGAGAATITVEASQDNSSWVLLDTMSLTLSATATSDTYYSNAPWKFVRGKITAISGTGADVSLYMGHTPELSEDF